MHRSQNICVCFNGLLPIQFRSHYFSSFLLDIYLQLQCGYPHIHINVHQTPGCLLLHLNLFLLKLKHQHTHWFHPRSPSLRLLISVSALPLSVSPHYSLSRSLFLQVLVAFISFSETMLLVYLSYKVSHSHDPIGQPVCGGVCGGFGWISDAWWWWLSTGHFCCAIKVEVMVFCLSTIDHFYINFLKKKLKLTNCDLLWHLKSL